LVWVRMYSVGLGFGRRAADPSGLRIADTERIQKDQMAGFVSVVSYYHHDSHNLNDFDRCHVSLVNDPGCS
jgi:hypothetical protein